MNASLATWLKLRDIAAAGDQEACRGKDLSLNVFPQPPGSALCWAAAAETIAGFYDRGPDPARFCRLVATIMTAEHRQCACNGTSRQGDCDHPAEMKPALEANKNYWTTIDGRPVFSMLSGQIDQGLPVVLLDHVPSNHFVLCNGYCLEPDGTHPCKIEVWDPEDGTVSWPGKDQLGRYMASYYTIPSPTGGQAGSPVQVQCDAAHLRALAVKLYGGPGVEISAELGKGLDRRCLAEEPPVGAVEAVEIEVRSWLAGDGPNEREWRAAVSRGLSAFQVRWNDLDERKRDFSIPVSADLWRFLLTGNRLGFAFLDVVQRRSEFSVSDLVMGPYLAGSVHGLETIALALNDPVGEISRLWIASIQGVGATALLLDPLPGETAVRQAVLIRGWLPGIGTDELTPSSEVFAAAVRAKRDLERKART